VPDGGGQDQASSTFQDLRTRILHLLGR